MNNKKIGLIGGVSPQATSVIYDKTIKLAQTKYGAQNNDEFPRIIIESVPVPDFISDKQKINKALEMLTESVKSLEDAGVTKLCIGSNTVHLLLPELQRSTNIEFISLIKETVNYCKKENLKKVGLVGSPMTLDSNLYTTPLQKEGIGIVLPEKEERKEIEEVIRAVIAGEIEKDVKIKYAQIINTLFDKGAEKVILGCTELPIALNYEALGEKVISTIDVLAESIVDYYYQD